MGRLPRIIQVGPTSVHKRRETFSPIVTERREDHRQVREATLLASKLEEGGCVKKCRWLPEAGKGKEMESPPRASRRNAAMPTTWF